MINCIIVDDEPIGRRGMKRLVDNDGRLNLLGMFNSGESARQFLEDNSADLIFLDIQMPGISGMELAALIEGKSLVIFTTAYSEYAVESYNVNSVDYLLKPIDPERFSKAVTKAETYLDLLAGSLSEEASPTTGTDSIIVRADRRFHRIPFDNILYASALKDYIVLHLSDKKIITRMKMSDLTESLPKDNFLRVNKSFIVNLSAVDSFDTNDVYIGETPIAIGATFRDETISRLMK